VNNIRTERGPFLLDDERWIRVLAERKIVPRPAFFFDRDGVLIEEREYLADPAGVELIPGCAELLREAAARGFRTVVVTNQSGIGRGLFGWREYELVEQRLIELLAREGACVDAVLANAVAPGPASPVHDWRKPRPGMLIAAASALNIDLGRSVIVGDKASDLAAGRTAGLRVGFLVSTGHGESEVVEAHSLATAQFQVKFVRSIAEVLAALYST
jgi:D-glycero-D-manno-heptose 1,7-bisphosphate phosphatase